MDREIAEETPKFKQIIPYIIFQKGDELLCYKRNAKGKENRLRKKYSIGIGGHINPIDGQGVDAISNAVTRELGEELKEFKIETVELYGLLYDPSDEVGRVHFGLIVLVTVAEDTVVESAEEEIENPTWIKLDKLRKLKNLENWSKLILDKKE
jgi:predicted NUDIX family phosphoesterase